MTEKLLRTDFALRAAHVLADKKAEDLVVIDISEQSSFADFFVNATALNDRHLAALAGEVEDELAKEGLFAKNIEGKHSGGWVLMDFGDLIINIFLNETRELYQLEKIWGDGKFLEIAEGNYERKV